MIRSVKHRGLKRLYERGDPSRVPHNHLKRIEDILALLDVAELPQALALPGYDLHPLKGDLKGFWSVKVSGNWRVVFRFADRNVFDVNLIDYH